MGVLLDPVCGDQGQQDRFLGLCLGAECVEACREFLLLSKRDLELVLTVLYLAKVYGLILAVDQKIDLNTFLGLASLAAPRAGQSLDSGDSESLLDLFQVAQAQHLEREAAPGVVQRAVDGGCPEMLVLIVVPLDEPEIEQGVKIDQLIER